MTYELKYEILDTTKEGQMEFTETNGIKGGTVVVILASNNTREEFRSETNQLGLVILAKLGDNLVRVDKNNFSISDERLIPVVDTNIDWFVYRPDADRTLDPKEMLGKSVSGFPKKFQPWRERVLFTMNALGLTPPKEQRQPD